MRVIGLDLGERRIGVAVSDPAGVVATPYDTWEVPSESAGEVADKSGAGEFLVQKLSAAVREVGAEAVVVGMPLKLDGQVSQAARSAEEAIDMLQGSLDIPIFAHDERFTTAIAEAAMLEADLSRKRRKQVIDKSAAAVMLQSWLDAHKDK